MRWTSIFLPTPCTRCTGPKRSLATDTPLHERGCSSQAPPERKHDMTIRNSQSSGCRAATCTTAFVLAKAEEPDSQVTNSEGAAAFRLLKSCSEKYGALQGWKA